MKQNVFLFPRTDFRLHPAVSRWLDEDSGGGTIDPEFERWLDQVEFAADTLRLGKIFVDAEVLKARFLCRPEKCAPWAGPDRWRCCCADVAVALEDSEKKRLEKRRPEIEKLLYPEHGRRSRRWFEGRGRLLGRPGGRCLFSSRDTKGRIRCLLYRVASEKNIDIARLQPFSCRLFPLVLVRLPRSRVLLSVVNRENHRFLGAPPPQRLGCLSQKPRLARTMAGTLDWLFGRGFARLLTKK